MADLAKISEQLSELTVLQASELVKMLEEKWDVKAAVGGGAVMMQAAGPVGGGAAEEKDSFDVELSSVGDKKINVIKAVRAVTGLGLKEAKDMVEKEKSIIKASVSKEEAEDIKSKLEAEGAKVTLK